MRRFKRIITYFAILVILTILFRGFIYRISVNYTQVKIRSNITLTDNKLIKEIDEKTENKVLNINEIIELSNQITSEKLDFTFNKVSSNPNVASELKKANCIGYSSLFNSIGNYIIKKQKMTDKYEFIHLVGKLDVFGFNIHNLFNSPFFKDHDFNQILNKKTGEKEFVDPSMRDYLKIEYVTSK